MLLQHDIPLTTLSMMCDHHGLLARSSRDGKPDPYRGHRTMDNAEALRLMARWGNSEEEGTRIELARRCIGFLRAARRDDGGFAHSRDAVGRWTSHEDDDCVRADVLWALCSMTDSELSATLVGDAESILQDAQEVLHPSRVGPSQDPVAISMTLLALAALPDGHEWRDEAVIARLARDLIDTHYQPYRCDQWEFFNAEWMPGAARIPAALWHAADILDDACLYTVARTTTEFIIDRLFEDGLFLPVGTEGWRRGDDMAVFDQRATEAASAVECLATAEEATGHAGYGQFADYAYRWFHGNNVRGVQLAHPEIGACAGAIRREGTDTRRDADATLALLHAHDAWRRRHALLQHTSMTVSVTT